MKRFFKWLGITVAALVVVLAVFALFFQWNWVRGYAGKYGGQAAGRQFAIDGDLHIDLWSWTPRVTAEQVRLSNADWAKEPNMVELGKVDFLIDLRQLLRGRIVLPELTLDKPKIALERADAERKNWDMGAVSPGNIAVKTTVPQKRTEFPVIGRLIVNDGTFEYLDKPLQLDLKSTISTATGAASDQEPTVRFGSIGTIQGKPFTARIEGGSILSLRDNAKPYPLTVDLRAGPTRFFAQGTMTDPVQLKGVDLHLDTQGDNLADIFPLTGIPLPPTNPYRLAGRLQKEGDIWTFTKFTGRVGQSDMNGDLRYDTSGKRNFIEASLVSNLLDIKDLSGFIGAGPADKDKNQTASDRLLPDVPLDLDRLRAADLDIRLVAERINAPSTPIENMDSRFVLQDGVLTVDPLKFGVAEGTVAGTLKLDGRQETPQLATELQLQQLSLKRFFEGTSFESLSAGRFGGHVQVTGQGKSLAAVMGAGDGRVTLVMAGGQLSTLILHAADIDVAKTAATYLGGDLPTDLRCAVTDFSMQHGLLTSNIFAIDTAVSSIDGDATINFADETMDVRVTGYPKKSSPLVARTPIVVSGRMKNPSIGIDPTGVALRGAAAAALGVLFAPAAILPFIELGVGKDANCADLIAHAGEPIPPTQLSQQPTPPSQPATPPPAPTRRIPPPRTPSKP